VEARVTRLLHQTTFAPRGAARAATGDAGASADLVPAVYGELRRMAAELARAAPHVTLPPTALVHEAYLRLVGKGEMAWESRRHFFFAAARALHDILVEEARRKAALKRGGGRQRVDLERLSLAREAPAEDLLALDEALCKLEREDPRKAQLVRLRFFAGLPAEETAAVMGIPLRTLEREWRYVRARLHRDLGGQRE
jgi:RNA polymerase sigma factor (TIGR02999 family)